MSSGTTDAPKATHPQNISHSLATLFLFIVFSECRQASVFFSNDPKLNDRRVRHGTYMAGGKTLGSSCRDAWSGSLQCMVKTPHSVRLIQSK